VRVAIESAYHHCNWTSRQRAHVLHPRPENQAALSQELDQMQGAGQTKTQILQPTTSSTVIRPLRIPLLCTGLLSAVLAASCGGQHSSLPQGHDLAASAQAGVPVASLRGVPVGTTVYVLDPPINNTASSPIKILAVRIPTPHGIVDLGHDSYALTQDGLIEAWLPGADPTEDPRRRHPRSLVGQVVAPHSTLPSGRFTMAALKAMAVGNYHLSGLRVVYEIHNRRYVQTIPGVYDVSTRGTS